MDRRKLAVIGLDGVGLDLARSLARRGVMPNLGRLMELGSAWPTTAPLPEVSPVCWTTMFSGCNSGEHGIFGFGHHLPGTYHVEPVYADQVRVPRLWDQLSSAGRRSVVLGVPLTYPATAINGTMISGFVAPEMSRAVHPMDLLPSLKARGYRLEAELEAGREDPAGLLADLADALEVRLKVFEELAAEDWDLLAAVITDTDRVNHFVWPALWQPDHLLAPGALEVYRLADGFLGRLWKRLQGEVSAGRLNLMVVADHSFGPITSEVYLNPWLKERGWLKVDGPEGAERILPATSALALDPGRIYLHWRSRFPGGWLEPGPEAEALAESISQALLEMTFEAVEDTADGPRVRSMRPIAKVHRGRDIYHGPHAHLAPDLVAEANEGFSLRARLGEKSVFGRSHLQGTHRAEGALALWVGDQPPLTQPNAIHGLHQLMAEALDL